jgi:hypothetical protein
MSKKVLLSTLKRDIVLVEGEVLLGADPISHVWVQGTVVSVERDMQEFLIDDDSAQVVVTMEESECTMDDIEVGQYLMIQGLVLVGEDDAGQQVVLLEPRLLSVLDSKEVDSLKRLWPYEVDVCAQP